MRFLRSGGNVRHGSPTVRSTTRADSSTRVVVPRFGRHSPMMCRRLCWAGRHSKAKRWRPARPAQTSSSWCSATSPKWWSSIVSGLPSNLFRTFLGRVAGPPGVAGSTCSPRWFGRHRGERVPSIERRLRFGVMRGFSSLPHHVRRGRACVLGGQVRPQNLRRARAVTGLRAAAARRARWRAWLVCDSLRWPRPPCVGRARAASRPSARGRHLRGLKRDACPPTGAMRVGLGSEQATQVVQ